MVDRKLAADPTETLIGHLGDLHHHYLEVLAELFDVAEDPGRLKNQKKTTIWLELRCG